MRSYIKKFQTISAHEVGLRQSSSLIESLTKVLKYIKEILTDDATSTLFEMIGYHLNVKDNKSHYINLELLSDQILTALRYAFISIGVYTSECATKRQSIDFFRDIYDGTGSYTGFKILSMSSEFSDPLLIPVDYNEFTKWLLAIPDIYTDEIPIDYDAFNKGLTLLLAKEWFKQHHDAVVDAHANTISDQLAQMLAVSKTSPAYWFIPLTFESSYYTLIDFLDYRKLMDMVDDRLVDVGSPHVVNYHDYPDTATLPLTLGYNEASVTINTFFQDIYPDITDENALYFVQLDTASIRAVSSGGGSVTLDGWNELMIDTGETDGRYTNKKYIDYYHDQLSFALSTSMTPEYQATLTSLRSNTNRNYNKVYHVKSILNKNNFGFECTLNINKLVEERTLDIINVIGLSKAVCTVSLVPYRDINNTLFNKLVVSFDNYNPAFTDVLIEKIEANIFVSCDVVVTMSKDKLSAYVGFGDTYNEIHFDNTNRMYDISPYFLFVVPRIAEYLKNTIRVAQLKLYNKALTQYDILALLASFRHI